MSSNVIRAKPRLIYYNVRDYGAVADGSTDSGAAIQAAMDACVAGGGGTVYFPGHWNGAFADSYIVHNRTLALGPMTNLLGDGPGQSVLQQTGTVQSLLNAGGRVNFEITSLQLNAVGHCLDFSGNPQSVRLNHLNLSAGTDKWCLYGNDAISISDSLYEHIVVSGNCTYYGLMLCGATRLIGFQAAGMKEAIRIFGGGNVLLGARIEVSEVGISVGLGPTGSPALSGSSAQHISTVSMESCNIGIRLDSITNSRITEIFGGGFSGAAPNGDGTTTGGEMQYGIHFRSATDTVFEDISYFGSFPNAGSAVLMETVQGCRFRNVKIANVDGRGGTWSGVENVFSGTAGVGTQGNSFESCPGVIQAFPLADERMTKGLRTVALAAYDLLGSPAAGKNLRAIAVPVTSGSTSVSVTFASAQSVGGIPLNTATAANTGGATLSTGRYYYRGTAVTALGEITSDISSEKAVTVSTANNSVVVTCAGSFTGNFRRIYRGSTTAAYNGYFALGVGVSTFTDIGQAFTGGGLPPVSGNNSDNGSVEPDSNYAVLVTPNWGTAFSVVGKATTGFTVNFGTAAPSTQYIDWFMVR